MTIELIKQLLDACYLAKRAREMLPALPEGVTSSYIQCLDVIQKLQTRGIQPKISDLSRSEERRVGKECRSRWSPYH